MKKSKGYTLPEVLISAGLILIILTAVANLLNMVFKVYKQSTYQIELINQNSLALNLISNELRQNLKIYQPQDSECEFDASSKPFIFSKYDPASDKVQLIGYILNYPAQQILRLVYECKEVNLNLNNLIELKEQRKILTQKTTQLKFIKHNNLADIVLAADLSENPNKNKIYSLKTKVRTAP